MRRPDGVAAGDWGTQIVFCSPVTKEETDDDREQVKRKFFVLKTYVVFNLDQVGGDHLDKLRAGNAPLSDAEVEDRFQQADAVIVATGADIRFGGNSAFYQPTGDYIQLPPRQQFDRPESIYETAGHELVHWTEAPHRLNWDRAGEGYAMGELVAEIGACFFVAELGLPTSDDLTRHCSYLQSWLHGLSDDPSFIFRASAQASKAVDFLMSFSRRHEPLVVG
jgi:antirestriction protein ArdC